MRIGGKLPKVGCVAIAIAQIMSYHKRPRYVNWEGAVGIKSYPEDKWYVPETKITSKLADLLKHIGDLVDMDYGVDNSGASSKKTPKAFHKLGYECDETLYEYDWAGVRDEIRHKRPVYVRANSIKNSKSILGLICYDDYDGGHAWVLDGIKLFKRTITTMRRDMTPLDPTVYDDDPDRHRYKVTTHSEYKNMVHCNFGWGGGGDAYYYSGIFDASKKPVEPGQPDYNEFVGYPNFQYKLEYLKGIYVRQ